MSNAITNLCRSVQMKPTQKCVLMALADRADDDGTAWPSIAWLSEWTCFSRTTVIEALKALETAGLIILSRTQGHTHRCIVDVGSVAFAIGNPSGSRTPTGTGAVPVEPHEEGADPSGCHTRTGAGPVREPDQYPSGSRTPTGTGAVPPRPGAVPDTSHTSIKTSKRQIAKSAKSSSFDPLTVDLPDWLMPDVWAMWVKYRAATKKPVTEDAARLQIAKLGKLRTEGHDVRLIVEAVIENGWQGLYAPKDGSTKARGTINAGGGAEWLAAAGFEHIAEAQNARCHIGNYREFRDGKRIAAGVAA